MLHRSKVLHLLIIGGGFAGAVSAIKLIDASDIPLQLTVVEPAEEIGRGIAYGSSDPDHLLNGTAQLFSLHPEAPDHLTHWLEGHARAGGWQPPKSNNNGEFAKSSPPRRLFGDYVAYELRQTLARAGERVTLNHVRGRAVDLDVITNKVSALLDSGNRIEADKAVLATGLHPRRSPVTAPSGAQVCAYYVDDIWKNGIDPQIATKQHVLLLGSSLTMLDALITLEKRGFKGRYTIVSRRGLIVQPRREVEPQEDILRGDALPTTALGALRIAQRERRMIAARGEDWQKLIPTMRTLIAPLWHGLSTKERLRLVRHLRSYWDIALHRAAAPSHAFLTRAQNEGRIEQFGARVLGLEILPGKGVAVTMRRRGKAAPEVLTVDAVINTSGHEFDWTRIDDPLVRNLLAKGIVRPHATSYGIDADPNTLAIIGSDGHVSSQVFAVGHPLRGVAWESSSISELLAEAIQLAQTQFPTDLNDNKPSRSVEISEATVEA